MPKNKGAGGKKRRKGKGDETKRELVFKIEGQEYAQVTKSIGNGFMEVMCFTPSGNVPRRAHIRGNMRKRALMVAGDIVLISTRDYQDKTCDIVLKYTSTEARILKNRKEIPENIDINNKDLVAEEPDVIFNDVSNDSDSSDDENVPTQNRNYDLPPSDSDEEISLNDL